MIKIDNYVGIAYYDYPLLAPEAIIAVRDKLLEVKGKEQK